MAGPLGEIVIYVDNSRTIEDMAGWHKRFGYLWRKTKIKKRRESKPHATSFICDGSPAQTAAHLAGKNSIIDGLFTVIEIQAIHTFGYPYIMFVEDGCPLHWGPM